MAEQSSTYDAPTRNRSRSREVFVDALEPSLFPFAADGERLRTTRRQRASIWDQFSRIHRKVGGVHRKLELAVVAESLLGCAADGPIVEFGCFKGLSTVKLSLTAAQAGRVLYVYDSFQGLPAPHETETTDVETHQGEVPWH